MPERVQLSCSTFELWSLPKAVWRDMLERTILMTVMQPVKVGNGIYGGAVGDCRTCGAAGDIHQMLGTSIKLV